MQRYGHNGPTTIFGRSRATDTSVYRELPNDPTTKFKREIEDVLQEALDLGIIMLAIKNALSIEQSRLPIMYLVQKVHKDIKKPPREPNCFGLNSLLQPLAWYLDGFLQNID